MDTRFLELFSKATAGRWDSAGATTPGRVDGGATPSRWDATPGRSTEDPTTAPTPSRWDSAATPSRWDATPARAVGETPSRWDATPAKGGVACETPKRTRSRWDETPVGQPSGSMTPMGGMTPGAAAFAMGTPAVTPRGGFDMPTPAAPSAIAAQSMLGARALASRIDKELDERNRYMSDEEIDAMLPQTGYKILPVCCWARKRW
ncbi:putative splicing factor 3B subunit 1 [Paratrimastix pyriformis]|uniref:Splicing factor 3B subunit 1 n=1 Tax=Paratrimastix pyriformis TaxID=342808 RepID=A0ABQ8UF48_9EUKA|nr:putative splicing factor 3B subunit 1 [Paratrimastix pyriformis]